MNNLLKTLKENKWQILILSLTVLIGLAIRLKGLGKWPLAIDEYYIVKSVENILKSGLPEWPNGGYYLRGLIYQYSVAGLILIGLKAEFAVRIIPVLLDVIVLIPLYQLNKKISGKLTAILLVILFSFSLWEIEFARFGRMYVPFQTLFIFYVLFMYKFIIKNERKYFKWILILSFLSIFIYEGAIFIALLNFIIFFWDKEKREFRLDYIKNKINYPGILICIIILTTIFIYNMFKVTDLSNLYPPGYTETHNHMFGGKLFNEPQILLTTIPDNIYWLIPLLFVIAFTGFSIIRILRLNDKIFINKLMTSFLLFISIFNLFGLVLTLGIIFLLLNWLSLKDLKKKDFLIAISAVIVNMIFWFLYAYSTNSWYKFFLPFEGQTTIAVFKKISLMLFNFPDLYFEFLIYLTTVPVQTLIFIVGIPAIILSTLNKKYISSLNERFILFILLLLILLVTSIDTELMETRYTFFLFPLVLLIFLLFFKVLSDLIVRNRINANITLVAFTIIYLILSDDFSLKHMINIDSKEYNFRMVYDVNKTRHYYPRWDVKTPAEIVNKESKEDDIIIIDEFNVEYYLNRFNYAYVNYNNADFTIFSVNGGKNERWTDAPLIYTNQHLLDIIKTVKKDVWFITILKPELYEINFAENFREYLHYKSLDKTIFVYKIPGGTEMNFDKKNYD
jgi:hypothetical protein